MYNEDVLLNILLNFFSDFLLIIVLTVNENGLVIQTCLEIIVPVITKVEFRYC